MPEHRLAKARVVHQDYVYQPTRPRYVADRDLGDEQPCGPCQDSGQILTLGPGSAAQPCPYCRCSY